MKLFLLAVLVLAFALMVFGYKAMNETGQSEDVKSGGIIPFLAGLIMLGLDFIICIVWLVVTR